jgi:hypothetical protein
MEAPPIQPAPFGAKRAAAVGKLGLVFSALALLSMVTLVLAKPG